MTSGQATSVDHAFARIYPLLPVSLKERLTLSWRKTRNTEEGSGQSFRRHPRHAKASRLNRRPSPDLLSQETQDLLCLFAGRLSFAFHPSLERLPRNPYALGNFGKMLIDDVPVVSQRCELFFGRLHEPTIPEIVAARSNMIASHP